MTNMFYTKKLSEAPRHSPDPLNALKWYLFYALQQPINVSKNVGEYTLLIVTAMQHIHIHNIQ